MTLDKNAWHCIYITNLLCEGFWFINQLTKAAEGFRVRWQYNVEGSVKRKIEAKVCSLRERERERERGRNELSFSSG